MYKYLQVKIRLHQKMMREAPLNPTLQYIQAQTLQFILISRHTCHRFIDKVAIKYSRI